MLHKPAQAVMSFALFEYTHGSQCLTIVTETGVGLVPIIIHQLCPCLHMCLGKKCYGRKSPVCVGSPNELCLYIC